MNTRARFAFAAVSFLAVSVTAHAQSTTIYTWTDENGVVHYVDNPTDHPGAVAVDAPEAYRPGTEGAYDQADAELATDAQDPEAVESYADTRRAELAANRENAQAAQQERERACTEASSEPARLEPSRRVYFTNSQGETERLDDEERLRMVAEAQTLVDQNCH